MVCGWLEVKNTPFKMTQVELILTNICVTEIRGFKDVSV